MSRSRISAFLAGAVALGTLSLFPMAGTASAEPTAIPAADDIVGVGSDTTQFAMDYLVDGATVAGVAVPGYNAGRTSEHLVSYDAIGAGLTTTIIPKQGSAPITRPNGSGAGKATLYGAGNNTAINFARSSSALSPTEVSNGLWQVPFAADGLKLAVSAASTHAPAVISPADLVKIYDGTWTNWSQLGGAAGVIAPLIPQPGSGTRSFFLAQLKAANGGIDVVLASTVRDTQEHDDTDIKANPDAVAPFSTGRALTTPTVALLGGTSAGGFEAKRALYNVFRQADLSAPWFTPIFGAGGFICSTAARPLIASAGFGQLATSAAGGACGSATQDVVTNFTTNDAVAAQATTTALTATASAQTVLVTVRVTAAAGVPAGSVSVIEAGNPVGSANLAGGVGIVSLAGVSAGAHTYQAIFTATDVTAFLTSTSPPVSVTVASVITPPKTTKKASAVIVRLKAKFPASKRVKAVVRVVAAGAPATGIVRVHLHGKRLGKATLVKGRAVLKLPKLAKGKHKLVFRYVGNAHTLRSTRVKRIRVTG